MKRAALRFAALLAFLAASVAADTAERRVHLLEVQDAIGPAVSDFIVRGIEKAEETDAELVILRMDTPGGLDSAMRDIIRKIVTATVPVATYVAPSGSRAASAGTYILYASHVAAMAPATNLGAATPVQIGGDMFPADDFERKPDKKSKKGDGEQDGEETAGDTEKEQDEEAEEETSADAMDRKIVNDAVAYIRGLARMHGRNADWAEKAVRPAASLTSEDALEKNVIDIVATDVSDLLEQLDGRELTVMGQERELETAGLAVTIVEPDWRSQLLAIITNPNVAYILMLLGVYGLFFELSNPGHILPGVVGAVSLLLALYAFQVLPVNYAGLALILLGLGFMVGEVFVPSFGALGIGGAIAFIVGSLILMDTDMEGYTLSIPLVIGFAAISAVFFLTVVAMVVRQRRRPPVSGREEMLGILAEAVEPFQTEGQVHVHGELWTARTSQPVEKGESVRVRALDGLTLIVEPLEESVRKP